MTRDNVGSVLVFRIGELGDTLASLPALNRIFKRHAGAKMILMTDAHPGEGWVSSWDVLKTTGMFSEVLFYRPPALMGLISRIRQIKPACLYYLAPTPRSKMQVWRDRIFFQIFCGISDVRGMAASDGWVGRRDARGAVALPAESERLLRLAGNGNADEKFAAPVGDLEKQKIDELWRASGLPLGGRVIALGPGAKKSASRWPLESYALLARRLLSSFPEVRLLVVGGGQEAAMGRFLAESVGPRAVSCAGALAVWESAEALRRCALFVGNNSGAMHLAALMNTRCVAVSSARDHAGIWDPQGEGHVVLRKNVPCSGCLLSDCHARALICLTSITVDEVFEACLSVLNE